MTARPRRTIGRLADPHGLRRGPRITVTVDGEERSAYLGESVAAVMMADGDLELRSTIGGAPRGVFCAMGVCFDCLAIVDGVPNTRACMTWAADGMVIHRQHGTGEQGGRHDGPAHQEPCGGQV